MEAGRDPEDPLEPLAGLALACVQPRALERLSPQVGRECAIASASSCGDVCSSKRRLRAPTTSRPPHTGTATAPCAYSVSAAPSEKSRSNASRSVTRTIVPVRAACAIGARAVSGKRRPGARVCAHPLGSTTTTASPSIRPSAPPRAPTSWGRPLDQRMRDVGRRDRCRECRREVLHPGHLADRRLRRVGGDGRAPAAPPRNLGHPEDGQRDGEVDSPAREGVRVSVGKPLDGLHGGRESKRPADCDRRERRPGAADHDDDRDDADERCVQRSVDEVEQGQEEREGAEREQQRDTVAAECRAVLPGVRSFRAGPFSVLCASASIRLDGMETDSCHRAPGSRLRMSSTAWTPGSDSAGTPCERTPRCGVGMLTQRRRCRLSSQLGSATHREARQNARFRPWRAGYRRGPPAIDKGGST